MTGLRRSAHRSNADRKVTRTLFTLAALLAAFLQAFAVQTHVHAYGLASAPIVAQASDNGEASDDTAHASTAHEQTLCVICQALASSGRALVPEAPAIALVASDNGEASDDTAHASTAHEQTLCVICQALASSGRALVPEAPAIALVASATSELAAIEIRDAPRAIAHAWQSRAPPIAL